MGTQPPTVKPCAATLATCAAIPPPHHPAVKPCATRSSPTVRPLLRQRVHLPSATHSDSDRPHGQPMPPPLPNRPAAQLPHLPNPPIPAQIYELASRSSAVSALWPAARTGIGPNCPTATAAHRTSSKAVCHTQQPNSCSPPPVLQIVITPRAAYLPPQPPSRPCRPNSQAAQPPNSPVR